MNGSSLIGVFAADNSNSIYVASIDAKDIYIANVLDGQNGYTLRLRNGDINYRKYINTIPFSLDIPVIREMYERAYRNRYFSWTNRGKEFSDRVINVTFKYSVKEYNRIGNGLYVKLGVNPDDIKNSCGDGFCGIYIEGEELVAFYDDAKLPSSTPPWILEKYKFVEHDEDGGYRINKNKIKTIMSLADLRRHLYANGFVVDGTRYVRYKRSSGSSRVGKCLFIDEKLFARLRRWDLAGLNVRNNSTVSDLAGFESYISLTSSSIIDTLEIEPHNILLIDDYVSTFKDDAVVTFVDDNCQLQTEHKEVEISNNIWDGQSMLDTSMFGKYERYGFILLRNRFFKSAAFNCDIQSFFRDHGITDVSQLNGITRAKTIEDIKLIVTPSSIKYLKFGTFDQWLDNLDSTFGIVKHDKPTHYFNGRLVQTHYQLINTLQMSIEEVEELLTPSLDYIRLLKSDPDVFKYHIKYPSNFELGYDSILTKNDLIYKLLGINEEFANTKLYADFRNACIKSIIADLRKGKILVNGTYCTLCGNPIEMLYASIGKFNGESQIGIGNVYNSRFAPGTILLGSRSPHVTMGNIWLPVNTYNEEIDNYFVHTDEIIYVNSIGENLLERLSGCDFDSDSVLITDDNLLVKAAQRNYRNFAVPTGMVHSVKVKKKYDSSALAELDINTSENKIGEIINLSQELNSRLWDMVNCGADIMSDEVQSLYYDIARLDVLSNLEIDRAKKILPVNNADELARLKEKYRLIGEDGRKIKPNFFKPVSQYKGYYNPKRNMYMKHHTSMDYIQTVLNKRKQLPRETKDYSPLSSILKNVKHPTSKQKGQAQRIITLIRQSKNKIASIWGANDGLSPKEKYLLAERERNDCIYYIGKMRISESVFWHLLNIAERQEYSDIASFLFLALFSIPNVDVISIIKQSATQQVILKEYDCGDIDIYGKKYKKCRKNKLVKGSKVNKKHAISD